MKLLKLIALLAIIAIVHPVAAADSLQPSGWTTTPYSKEARTALGLDNLFGGKMDTNENRRIVLSNPTNSIAGIFTGSFIGSIAQSQVTGLSNALYVLSIVPSRTNILDVTLAPYNAAGDGVTDDTAAITNCLRDGAALGYDPYFPPRTYKASPFRMHSNQKLIAYGSRLLFSSGSAGVGVTMDYQSTNIIVQGVIIDGGKAYSKPSSDDGRTGLLVWNCQQPGWIVKDVAVFGFGKGINVYGLSANTAAKLLMDNIIMQYCGTGLQVDPQAEYLNLTRISSTYNIYGAKIYGGNNNLVGSDFSWNTCNLMVQGGSVSPNAAHTTIASSSFNHGTSYALLATNITLGLQFIGCEFLPPLMYFTNVQGVKIIGGMLGWNTTGNEIRFDNSTNCHIIFPSNPYFPTEPNPITLTLNVCSNVDMATGLLLGTGAGAVAGTDYVAPTGSGAALTVDASGFNGNLATTDNTVQEIAQKLDDLVASGGSGDTNGVSYVATGVLSPAVRTRVTSGNLHVLEALWTNNTPLLVATNDLAGNSTIVLRTMGGYPVFTIWEDQATTLDTDSELSLFVQGAGGITLQAALRSYFYPNGVAAISLSDGAGAVILSPDASKSLTVSDAGVAVSSLTATRVTFAGTAGLLTDDAGFTFNGSTDTLSVRHGIATTNIFDSEGFTRFAANGDGDAVGATEIWDGNQKRIQITRSVSGDPFGFIRLNDHAGAAVLVATQGVVSVLGNLRTDSAIVTNRLRQPFAQLTTSGDVTNYTINFAESVPNNQYIMATGNVYFADIQNLLDGIVKNIVITNVFKASSNITVYFQTNLGWLGPTNGYALGASPMHTNRAYSVTNSLVLSLQSIGSTAPSIAAFGVHSTP